VKRLPIAIGLLLAVAGCTTTTAGRPTAATADLTTAESPAAPTQTAAVAPPEPVPVRDGTCPYLDETFVAETNGQQVGDVRVSDDQPHPACFFYRSGGGEQLRVRVYVGDAAVAKIIVDGVVPVATSDPATLPGGWDGGKQPTDDGAVYAVAKDGTAVVVVTNQKQTIKASRVAEQVITALGL
jgi:UPF0176 protein